MTWSEIAVIVLAVMLVLTWVIAGMDHRGIDDDQHEVKIRQFTQYYEVKRIAEQALRTADAASMDALKARNVADAKHCPTCVDEEWVLRKLTKVYEHIDSLQTVLADARHSHEEKFHPNELKRLELQKVTQETEAQAARKAINPELI